jgi:hypothetical protein
MGEAPALSMPSEFPRTGYTGSSVSENNPSRKLGYKEGACYSAPCSVWLDTPGERSPASSRRR